MSINVQQAFEDISKGDGLALDFCIKFYEWVQMFDDLIDRDKPVSPSDMATINFHFIAMLAHNEFWLANKATLLPVIMASTVAYIDSERFKTKPHPLDRISTQVLKSQYQDVFFQVAYIKGGWNYMLEITTKYRDFNFDPVELTA